MRPIVNRSAFRAGIFDALCVLALVVIGTRNHDTDTGLGGVLFVGLPFWIALALSRAIPQTRIATLSNAAATSTWITTVVIGMALRNLVFDRGTAVPFVIVASLFLFASMFGWRALARRSTNNTSTHR